MSKLVSPILTVGTGLRTHKINISMARDRKHYRKDVRVNKYCGTSLDMGNVPVTDPQWF